MQMTEKSPKSQPCARCGDVVSVRELSKVSDGEFCCYDCVVKTSCSNCGKLTTAKKDLPQDEALCGECTTETVPGEDGILDLIKDKLSYLLLILGVVFIRVLDELIRGSVRLTDELVVLRPFSPAIIAFADSGGDLILYFLAFGFVILGFNSILPVQIFNIITFPGTVCHELAHIAACKYYNLEIMEVVYFQLKSPLGYVRYQKPTSAYETIGVAAAPILINSIMALLIVGISAVVYFRIEWWIYIILIWLGFSIAARAIPSTSDTENIWEFVKQNWRDEPRVLFTIPIVLVLYLSNLLRIIYFNFLYASFLVILGHTAVLVALA